MTFPLRIFVPSGSVQVCQRFSAGTAIATEQPNSRMSEQQNNFFIVDTIFFNLQISFR